MKRYEALETPFNNVDLSFAQKLLFKKGFKVLIVNSPTEYLKKLAGTEATILTNPS